jgi:hypothetical protein
VKRHLLAKDHANRISWFHYQEYIRFVSRFWNKVPYQRMFLFVEGDFPRKSLFQKLFPIVASIFGALFLTSYLLYPGSPIDSPA